MKASAFPMASAETLEWLQGEDNPAVAAFTLRALGEGDGERASRLWAARNTYAPVAEILARQRPDGSWDAPARDYQKYGGSLWQVHFLGELWADGQDARVLKAAEYAFARQLPDGSWSCSNMRASGAIPCLTANVGRALARLGFSRDERVIAALRYCANLHAELGCLGCRQLLGYQLNGYCHMLAPKLLLFLREVPQSLWPEGADAMRDECVARLREKSVFRSLPKESKEFNALIQATPSGQRDGLRERYLAEHPTLTYAEKPGWLRFGYPLSYNSDALESMDALASLGEPLHAEYEPALDAIRDAGATGRWHIRNSLNGKMLADVEAKGEPSKWLTLRALKVLAHFSDSV